jgi:hypothetical protein
MTYESIFIIVILACAPGTYGSGCRFQCHCKNTDAACDQASGKCAQGCAPGWQVDSCSESEFYVTKHYELLLFT